MALRIIDAGNEGILGVSIGTYNYGACRGRKKKDRILGRMNVEYMPKMTAGTHMGFVLFEADRWLKGLSHGRDNETGSRLSVRVPGYLTQPHAHTIISAERRSSQLRHTFKANGPMG